MALRRIVEPWNIQLRKGADMTFIPANGGERCAVKQLSFAIEALQTNKQRQSDASGLVSSAILSKASQASGSRRVIRKPCFRPHKVMHEQVNCNSVKGKQYTSLGNFCTTPTNSLLNP